VQCFVRHGALQIFGDSCGNDLTLRMEGIDKDPSEFSIGFTHIVWIFDVQIHAIEVW